MQSVLPGGCIHDQKNLVRRAGDHLLRRSAHLVEFRHQIVFGVQPARGVDNEDIDVACLRRLQGIVENRRRVASLLGFDHLDAGALAPDFELLDCRRAKGIGGAKQHRLALLAEVGSQFAGSGRLARPVDAHHHDHGGWRRIFSA